MPGCVLSNEDISGAEALDRRVGNFNLGYSLQMHDILDAGSVVVVVY